MFYQMTVLDLGHFKGNGLITRISYDPDRIPSHFLSPRTQRYYNDK